MNHHQPLYSCSKTHGSNETIRKVWQPLYDQYKVDLVINGHVHDYERTKAIRGLDASGMGIVVPAGEGTTYVVSGGSGAPLYTEFEEDECAVLMEAHEATRNYVILNVEAAQLKFTAYRLDGSVLDTFTLTK